MSSSLDFATAKQTFDTRVQTLLQNRRAFAGICDERHGNTGDVYNMPIGGQIEMEEIGFSASNIPVSNLNETNINMTLGNFGKKTAISGGYRTLFAYDKIEEHATAHAKAIARAQDKLLVDAIFVNDGGLARFQKIDKTVGATTGLNVQKIVAASDLLDDAGMDSMKNAMIAVKTKKSLSNDAQFVSWDYNMDRPLMNGRVKGFYDIAFYQVGSAGANKLPVVSGTPDIYNLPVFGYDMIRVVYNRDPKSTIYWNKGEDRYEFISIFTGRARLTQDDGLVYMECEVI